MQMEERLRMRDEALEALRESAKTYEIAERLLSVGNITEAERLQNEARHKRTVFEFLMAESAKVRRGH